MSQNSNSSLPQGFSIFQPALGAQLQFFPAVGSQELDDLLNAYLPGPLPASEKRATAVIDFLEHTQVTGQSFKFYPVYTAASVTASPATSASSSFNVSPVNATWDWSQTSRTASVSSRTSSHRVSKASPTSRHRATDFSHIPGMKIMTKDGMDVTNSASRGSKTKEQRDHAHLMRIIKACDSCRKKKIRCDPSHKKRAAAQASASTPVAASRTAKPRTSPPPPLSEPQSVSVSPLSSDFTLDTPLFEFDQSFTFDNLESFDPAAANSADLWDEFLQFPPMDFTGDGMDAFVDPAYLSSQPSSDVSASGSASPVQLGGAPPGLADVGHAEPRVRSPESGGFELPGSGSAGGDYADYADFNLYSPGSSFSEDDRMLEVSSSSTSVRGLSTPASSSGLSPTNEAIAYGDGQLATNRHDLQGVESSQQELQTVDARGLENHNPQLQTHSATLARLEQLASQSNDIAVSTNSNGQLVICCPPGTVVLTSPGTSSDGQDVSSSSVASASVSSSRRVMETISTDLQPAANVDLQLAEIWHRNTDPVISQTGSNAVNSDTGGADAATSAATLLTEIRQASSSVASINTFLENLYEAALLVATSPGETQIISPAALSSVGEEEPGVLASAIACDGSSVVPGLLFTHGFAPSSVAYASVTSVSASGTPAYDTEASSASRTEPSAVVCVDDNMSSPASDDHGSTKLDHGDSDFRSSDSVSTLQTSQRDQHNQPTDSATPAILSTTQQPSTDNVTSLEDGQLATIMSHAISSVMLAMASSVLSDLARWHSDGAAVRSVQRSSPAVARSRSLAAYQSTLVSVC